MNRSYYQNTIEKFLTDNEHSIFGQLSQYHQHELDELQKNAWLKQIDFLKTNLKDIKGHIYFEFSIPRMGKRVDNIIITQNIIFVIEFKIGENKYPQYAKHQAIDYCLDLLNFHEESHNKRVIPILVATNADEESNTLEEIEDLRACLLCNSYNFKNNLISFLKKEISTTEIDILKWEKIKGR